MYQIYLRTLMLKTPSCSVDACFCNCDHPRENRPSSHLEMIVDIPVLKVVIAFAHVWPALSSRIVLIDILNLI